MHNAFLPLLALLGIGAAWALSPLALVAMRLVDYQRLKALRRYVIVLNLIVAAVLTTPEVLTQLIAAVVLQAFYEMTVLMAWFGESHEKKRGAGGVSKAF
jgi:sec-independent protein translocase protein TatC